MALIPDRDIPPAEAKALVGDRKTENELTQDEIAARLTTLRRDVGDPVDGFIADSWTLEFDLALRPELAESVHQAVQLAKTSSRNPERLAKIVTQARETYESWKAAGHSATEIAVKIYKPVYHKEASKAEVAEQLAAILRQRTDTPEQMRERLPPYLVRAIDYVTGGYVPGAPVFPVEPEAEDEESGAPDRRRGGGEGVAPCSRSCRSRPNCLLNLVKSWAGCDFTDPSQIDFLAKATLCDVQARPATARRRCWRRSSCCFRATGRPAGGASASCRTHKRGAD